MPYSIIPQNKGYLVCSEDKCFSKKPISKKMAMKQRVAIAISEQKKTGKPMKNYFV